MKTLSRFSALFLCLVLTVSVCLCGCSKAPDPTEAPTAVPTEAAPTEAPTEAPIEAPTETPTEAPTEPPVTEPVFSVNPLTGETVEGTQDLRIFGVAINNVPPALPHVGLAQADLVFEMFVNDYATRCLAFYTDIAQVETIGSVRSMRYNFTDLALAYDAIIAHAGGSDEVINDAYRNKIDHFNVDTSTRTSYSFRSEDRSNAGYSREHTLFAIGSGLVGKAEKEDMRITRDSEKNYGLNFTEDGTPTGGEDAGKIDIIFTLKGHTKQSTMTYSEELGKYVFTQYGKGIDSVKEENLEAFENVFVILAKVSNKGVYHVAKLEGSGEGYYACGGKLVKILWHHENDTDPITFTLEDGTPLVQGIGTSYIAIAPTASSVSWQ